MVSLVPLLAGAQSTVVRVQDVRAYAILAGQGDARILLDSASVGLKDASLSRLTLKPKAKVPLHRHPHAAELLYLIQGKGMLRVGQKEPQLVEAHTAVFIPAGVAHSFEVVGNESVEAVQVYVPGGPEERFRDPKKTEGTVLVP